MKIKLVFILNKQIKDQPIKGCLVIGYWKSKVGE